MRQFVIIVAFHKAYSSQFQVPMSKVKNSQMTDDRNWDGNLISVAFYQVKLYLGPLAGELAAELPFTLMHPKVRNYFYNFTFLDPGVFIPC